MKDSTIVTVVGIVSLTILGVVYFITVKQDSTVLTTLSSVIGGVIGYAFGKRR